ncbi:MAG: nucleotidyltransferase domain-containing protein [Minisyncoccia bacterium]
MEKMLNNVQRGLIEKIAQEYSLELVLLFGSRVSGRIRKDSDFDIAYLSRKNLDLTLESQMSVELAKLFKSENIDLVNLKNAKPLIYYSIFNECQVIFEINPMIFSALRVYSFKKYIENRFLYEEKFRRLQKRLDNIKIQ